MDLIKIGQYIAEKRKAKDMTQLELANALHLSEKTISKWECGKGFPEVSTVLPLCAILEITANELLSGQDLKSEALKKEHTEQNILNLLHSKSDYTLKKWAVILIALLSILLIVTMAILLPYMKLPIWAEIIIMVLTLSVFIVSMIPLCAISNSMGTFKCKHCGHKFTPKLAAFVYGMHTWNKRYLKCPHCQKKSFCQFESYKQQNKLQ